MHAKKQTGFSIIELIIGIAIGLILVVGVLQVMVNGKQAFRVTNAQTFMQDNARFALDYLTHTIRQAGFWGCTGKAMQINNQLNIGPTAYSANLLDLGTPISGTDTSNGAKDIIAGTDTLTVRGAMDIVSGLAVQPPWPNRSDPINVAKNNKLTQGTMVLISDCSAGDVFQITNANPSTSGLLVHGQGNAVVPGNASNNLSKAYRGGAFVYSLLAETYSIQNGADGQPALFRTTVNGSTELAPDIENLQVLYGEDTDSDKVPNRYVTASNVTDMNNVMSLRISLVAISNENNIVTTPQNYFLQDSVITPTDRHLRKVYTSTIALRNRILN